MPILYQKVKEFACKYWLPEEGVRVSFSWCLTEWYKFNDPITFTTGITVQCSHKHHSTMFVTNITI